MSRGSKSSGGDNQEVVSAGDVSGLVGTLDVIDLAGGGEIEKALAGLGGDDGDVSMGVAEGLDFGLGQIAGTEDEAAAAGEFEEDGEQVHGIVLFHHSPAVRWRAVHWYHGDPSGRGWRRLCYTAVTVEE